ncbi:MAG: bifunctional riboflavin kinase/FMN adenylyltransferase, partial [Flavobacteriales bacterium]
MKVHHSLDSLSEIQQAVVTMGTFDGVHKGHAHVISFMNELARSSNGETVLLSFDPHPRKVLFPDRPTVPLLSTMEEKRRRLESVGLDHLIILPFTKEVGAMLAFDFVRDYFHNALKAKHIVVGHDHRFGRGREGHFETLLELSDIFKFTAHQIGAMSSDMAQSVISSTKIRQHLTLGEINKANDMLGYSYRLSGKVVHGNARGRELGFRTANLEIGHTDKLVPKTGVYLVQCQMNGVSRFGLTNIGFRPTFET